MTALLALVLLCAAPSATTTEALGLGTARIVLFSVLVAALVAWPILRRRSLPEPPADIVVLALLFVLIAIIDVGGRVDPLDYRPALLLLIIYGAPALARELRGLDVGRFTWRLLSIYVLGTAAYQLFAEPAAVARGYGSIVRYDPTGSVVMHASFGTVHLALAGAIAWSDPKMRRRAIALVLGACSLFLVLSTGTRTVIVTLGLFALFHVLLAREKARAGLLVLAAATAGLCLVVAHGALFGGSLLDRFAGVDAEDWSSGRWPSTLAWLDRLGDRPFGLGLGAVRETLADGKPALEGELLLEWPHQEPLRFFIEAGPIGAAFVLVLLASLVRSAMRAGRRTDDPVHRTLVLVLAADLLAEASFQNLLNAIYHVSALTLVLALAAARQAERPAPPPLPLLTTVASRPPPARPATPTRPDAIWGSEAERG